MKEKNPIKCLECIDKYIDCRDLIFCRYGELRYIGRKKDYEIPEWCPKKDIPHWEEGVTPCQTT